MISRSSTSSNKNGYRKDIQRKYLRKRRQLYRSLRHLTPAKIDRKTGEKMEFRPGYDQYQFLKYMQEEAHKHDFHHTAKTIFQSIIARFQADLQKLLMLKPDPPKLDEIGQPRKPS